VLKNEEKQKGCVCLECWYIIFAISNLYKSATLRIPSWRYIGVIGVLILALEIMRIALF